VDECLGACARLTEGVNHSGRCPTAIPAAPSKSDSPNLFCSYFYSCILAFLFLLLCLFHFILFIVSYLLLLLFLLIHVLLALFQFTDRLFLSLLSTVLLYSLSRSESYSMPISVRTPATIIAHSICCSSSNSRSYTRSCSNQLTPSTSSNHPSSQIESHNTMISLPLVLSSSILPCL